VGRGRAGRGSEASQVEAAGPAGRRSARLNPSRSTIKRLKRLGITITCGKCKRNTMRLDQSVPNEGDVVRLRLYLCIVKGCGGRELTEERSAGQTTIATLPRGERRASSREAKTA